MTDNISNAPKCHLFYIYQCQQIGDKCSDCIIVKLAQEVAKKVDKGDS